MGKGISFHRKSGGWRSFARALLLCSAWLLLIPSWAHELEPGEALSLGVHPYLPAPELERRFRPLADYLARNLDRDVRLLIGASYEDHISHVGQDQVDIAYLGPAAYLEVTERFGPRPLLARLEVNGKPVFYGYVVSRNDSDVLGLQDLAGKRFAFGSQHSTMSYTLPRYLLLEQGVDLHDLQDHRFMGSHVNVALSVLAGRADAGGVKEEVFRKYEGRGLREIAVSPPISEHLFVARNGLPDEVVSRMQDLLMNLHDETDGVQVMRTIKSTITRFVPVTDSDYDTLREVRKQVREADRR